MWHLYWLVLVCIHLPVYSPERVWAHVEAAQVNQLYFFETESLIEPELIDLARLTSQ